MLIGNCFIDWKRVFREDFKTKIEVDVYTTNNHKIIIKKDNILFMNNMLIEEISNDKNQYNLVTMIINKIWYKDVLKLIKIYNDVKFHVLKKALENQYFWEGVYIQRDYYGHNYKMGSIIISDGGIIIRGQYNSTMYYPYKISVVAHKMLGRYIQNQYKIDSLLNRLKNMNPLNHIN